MKGGATLNVGVTRLLDEARAFAISRTEGLEATPANLRELAALAKGLILKQVLLGSWAAHGINHIYEMQGLVVSARLGNQLIGEPPIALEFDFAETKLMTLVVESKRPS